MGAMAPWGTRVETYENKNKTVGDPRLDPASRSTSSAATHLVESHWCSFMGMLEAHAVARILWLDLGHLRQVPKATKQKG